MPVRRLRLLLVTFLALILAGTLVAPQATAAGSVRARPGVVGTWTATVYRDDGTVEQNDILEFTADGKVTATGAAGVGHGTWSQLGPQRYSYTERTDLDFGYLVVTAQIVVIGNHFAGYGQGTAYDYSGTVLGTGQSIVIANRAA